MAMVVFMNSEICKLGKLSPADQWMVPVNRNSYQQGCLPLKIFFNHYGN